MKKRYYGIIIITIIFALLSVFLIGFTPIEIEEEEEAFMGNNKSYKFTDLDINSTKLPANTHLIIECSDGDLYLVDSSATTDFYTSKDKGATWTKLIGVQILNPIISLYYSRSDENIYIITDGSVNGNIKHIQATLSSDELSALYVLTTGYYGFDTFRFTDETYQNGHYDVHTHENGINLDLEFRKSFGGVTNANNMGTFAGRTHDMSWVVLEEGGTDYVWFLWQWSNENVELWKWERDTNNFTEMEDLGNDTVLADKQRRGIAYDGSNILYFIVKDTSDNKYYLHTYNISGDSLTKLSEYNIALMLDRNCSGEVPNEYEKAFDVAKDSDNNSIIWEIKPKKGGLIQLQTINKNANIIAITDNFIMFGGGEMYEYTDVIADNTIAEGKVNKGIFPILEKGRFNCHPDDATLFYNDDSLKVYDDADEMILFAKITDKSQDENGIYQFGLDAYANELWRRTYSKSHSSNKTSEKQQDNLDNACGFCHRDSSIVATTTDYSYEQDRPPMAIFGLGRFMERQIGYAEPDGKVWTKAYNGLAKAPLYYKATYNFRDEVVGTQNTNISLINLIGGGDSNRIAEVITENDGHKKVVKFTSDGDNGQIAMWYYYDMGESGTITCELYVKYIDLGQGYFKVIFRNEAHIDITMVLINTATGMMYNYYGNGAGGNGNVSVAIASDTWFHYKVEMNPTTDKQSVWIDKILKVDAENFLNDRVATSIADFNIRMDNGGGVSALEGYIDAMGIYPLDPNYNVGDNLVAWDVEKNGNLDLINIGDKPSYYVKKLGITRATCVGSVGISQTYSNATLEDGKTVLPLKEYRDLKIQATTEALQVATALFNVFSKETKFVGLRVVNQEFVQPGKTVNFANSGDISISETDLMVLFYNYDFVNDVYDLMVLTDNIVTLKEFESYLDRSALMVHQNSTAVRENQFPIGTIAMFSGTWVDDSTKEGWYKCDGNNGTINLVNKFVRGAATSGAMGGSDDAVVVQHNHGASSGSDGAHDHQVRTNGAGIGNLSINAGTIANKNETTVSTDSVGGHTHSIANDGVSGVGANKPAYYALIFIQRIR